MCATSDITLVIKSADGGLMIGQLHYPYSMMTLGCLTYTINWALAHEVVFYKAIDPGHSPVKVNVCTESLHIINVKVKTSLIGQQMAITEDNVNVKMCVLYPHILSLLTFPPWL